MLSVKETRVAIVDNALRDVSLTLDVSSAYGAIGVQITAPVHRNYVDGQSLEDIASHVLGVLGAEFQRVAGMPTPE
jgi:hypothetical protein